MGATRAGRRWPALAGAGRRWPALAGAKPMVLSAADGFQFEKIAGLRPDLILATNRRLSAVRENRLVFTNGETAGAIHFTVLSLPYVLDELVPALASGLRGRVGQIA